MQASWACCSNQTPSTAHFSDQRDPSCVRLQVSFPSTPVTPQRLSELVTFLRGLGLDPEDIGGPGANAEVLAAIDEALCHSSLGEARNHERLEFLGDAVLRLAATEFLRCEFGTLRVGEQSALRGRLVSDQWLAELARTIGMDTVLRLGPMAGGDTAGRATVMAECAEALLGGIYLAWGGVNGGLEPLMRWLTPHWHATAVTVLADPHRQNWKSALQEWSQGQGLGLPHYVCEERSLAHGDPRRFFCKVQLNPAEGDHSPAGRTRQRTSEQAHPLGGDGWGGSRRQAEQAAARDCLGQIQNP
ncbi:MAG: ribonuclease III [Cyanobacteria bacterium K_Offshore_surface_m2_239]|nr:ribonuclease III [Cyanobacteria bacterium K_Offshore_surface_m2_239]